MRLTQEEQDTLDRQRTERETAERIFIEIEKLLPDSIRRNEDCWRALKAKYLRGSQ